MYSSGTKERWRNSGYLNYMTKTNFIQRLFVFNMLKSYNEWFYEMLYQATHSKIYDRVLFILVQGPRLAYGMSHNHLPLEWVVNVHTVWFSVNSMGVATNNNKGDMTPKYI